MSVLTVLAAKSSNDFQAASSYKSATFTAVGSGNSLVMIIRALTAELPFVITPQAYNGTTDVPMVLMATDNTVAGETSYAYKLDNVTHSPTSIRYKVNASSGATQQASDVFEIGNTGGSALTLRVDQKSTESANTTFSVGYTTLTANECGIAYFQTSGSATTPTAPWSLTTHGNYGIDSIHWNDAGTVGAKTAGWTTGASAPHVWILSFGNNDPAPTVTTVTSSGVTEGGNMVFTVSLSGATSSSANYAFSLGGTATAGTDYTSPLTSGMCNNDVTVSGGNFVVPTAVSSWTVTVPTTQDTTDEDNETIVLTVGGIASTGGTITDDDAPPTVSISDATESFGTVTHTLTLSQASGKTITVQVDSANGSKTAGTHYTAIVAQTVTFNPGETEKTVPVTVL